MPGIVVAIDEPTNRSGTGATQVLIRGWAANPASERGTGVSRVDVYLDGGPDQGGFYLGQADYGSERADVADALGGQRFLMSGWSMVTDIPRGPHTLVAVAAPTGNPRAAHPRRRIHPGYRRRPSRRDSRGVWRRWVLH